MLLIILLIMGFIGLVVAIISDYEVRNEQNKRLGPDFDSQTERYNNLLKNQIDKHF